MIAVACNIAYVLMGLWIARLVFRGVADDVRRICPSMFDWPDVIMCAVVALVAGALWPPVAAFFLLRRAVGAQDADAFVRRVGGESRNARLARQAEEIRAHERHIAELERELRIVP